jgi:hypothetical protein
VFLLLKPEYEQHGLVALLAQFGCEDVPAFGDVADTRQDGDVLLAAGNSRRRIIGPSR